MRQTILRLLLLIILLAATCFGSYYAVVKIWGEEEITSVTTENEGTGSTETPGEPVKNMLVTAYYYDYYVNGIVEYAAVRFFNVNTKECNYIFFPGNTKLAMSDSAYQALYSASTNIKQNSYLRDISIRFSQDSDRYGYTAKALEDVIGTNIDYYEAITSDDVVRMVNILDPVSFNVPKSMSFKNDSNIKINLKKGEQTLMGDQVKGMLTKPELYSSETERLKCSMDYIKAYLSAIHELGSRDDMGAYYQEYYSMVKGNTNFAKMRPYMDYLYQVTPDNIKMSVAQGKVKGEAYVLDYKKIKATVKEYLNSAGAPATTEAAEEGATTEAESKATTEEVTTEEATTEEVTEEETTEKEEPEEPEEPEDSKDLDIEIYNSTTINGLAARWKDKLTKDGYTITATETERNYHLKECVIYVTKKGQGEDLLEYFPNAEIKVGKLKKADIRIVLGTNNNKVK